ncbi:hypothetical protein ACFXG4_04900 [Nocardia sp. NPDC059246]|uniref:hypothetical protein n=1 Tax=unclassified Nocardia TaxID=2637762 RepID=UPI00368D5C5E
MTEHCAIPTIADISKIVADSVREAGDRVGAAIGVPGVGETANAALSGMYGDIAIEIQRTMIVYAAVTAAMQQEREPQRPKALRIYDGDWKLKFVLVDKADYISFDRGVLALPSDTSIARWIHERATHSQDVFVTMDTDAGRWLGRLTHLHIEYCDELGVIRRGETAVARRTVSIATLAQVQPNFRVLAAKYPDGRGWRAIHSGTSTAADFVDRDDIKFQMARAICRKTGVPLDDMHVLLDVVSLDELAAAENA